MSIENVTLNGEIIAIIIRKDFSHPGVHFVTSNDFSQQLAYIQQPTGKIIQPHLHNLIHRDVVFTQEVLFIKKGRLRVDFYDDNKKYLESKILEAGDVILLAMVGHGFEVLEDVEMIEVKQGPYVEHDDKVRFDGITSDEVAIKKVG
jgi:mannose-6-phosphate isomerase-like protein (cupin superfamily)